MKGSSAANFDRADPKEKEIMLLKAIINAQAGQINSLEHVVDLLKGDSGDKQSGGE